MKKWNHFSNKNGFSLIWVIITMLVLSILGFAIISVSIAEANHAVRSERRLQTEYIARSGVELGFQLLGNISSQESVDDIITVANGLSGLNKDLGNGSYTITYSQEGDVYIVIASEAIHSFNNNIKSRVLLYVPVKMLSISGDVDWEEAPRSWKRADNLWDDVDPDSDVDVDLTGSSIVFSGSPTKSPQNSSDPSTFRSSVMLFRGVDNNGVTFQQQKNTNHISFDSEVLIFEGSIRLRDPNKEVKLNISDKVTDADRGYLVNWSYSEKVGFENFERYLDFIGLGDKVAGDPEYEAALSLHQSYGFTSTDRYGLVFFDDEILKDGEFGNLLSQGNGVYYFKDGINLNASSYDIGTSVPADLIIVHENDPIRDQRVNKQGEIAFQPSLTKQFYIAE